MSISSPEFPPLHERKLKNHQDALKRIVRPDHVEENANIYEQFKLGAITLEQAQLQHEMLLVKVASIDHMTGLDNARAAEVKLAQLIEYCAQNNIPILGMHFDGDDFRLINIMGHHIGDQVIKALGQALAEATRDTDMQFRLDPKQTAPQQSPVDKESATKARLGGDEFLVALPGATTEDAHTIFDRISDNFAKITDQDIPEYRQRFGRSMTITAGAAQYDPQLDQNPQEFIKRCERETQRGKETQKGTLTLASANVSAPALTPV